MKGNAELLINDLIDRTEQIIERVESWGEYPDAVLNGQPSEGAWSALECLEHLNRYGDFYLPEISERIHNSKNERRSTTFKSSMLGEYFAKSMLPKEKLNKINTFKSMNPSLSGVRPEVRNELLDQQRKMLKLLDRAKEVDLSRTKTNISISKWIKLRLGDTFRVVIYHNERHIVQAEKAIAQAKEQRAA